MLVKPMLCEIGDPSVLDAREGDLEWIVETKFDGERIIAQHDEGRVHLWTRRDISVTHKFPEIVTAVQHTLAGKKHSILDGELIVGSRLKDLAKRQINDPLGIKILSRKMPATYMVFDVLLLDGKNIRPKKLSERKEILRDLVMEHPNIAFTPFYPAVGLRDRFESFIEAGHEGLIMKHLPSTYQAGRRSREWLKFKKSDDVEVEIIGASRSEAGQAFKSLIMMRNGKYFGQVGTGFTEEERRRILQNMERDAVDDPVIPLPKNVDPVVLTRPRKALVKVLEISDSGSPRAPVWVGFIKQ